MDITKKQLQEQYGLSDNTVYKTLKACGLDTSKTAYTREEIEDRFVKAREILKNGGSYQDVERCFAIKSAAADAFSDEELGDMEAASPMELRRQIGKEVLETYDEVMDQAVADIVPYLPLLLVKATNKYSQNGSFRRAFEEFRGMLRNGETPFYGMGPGAGENGGLKGDVNEEWLEQYQQELGNEQEDEA